jgi:hypothetical protein
MKKAAMPLFSFEGEGRTAVSYASYSICEAKVKGEARCNKRHFICMKRAKSVNNVYVYEIIFERRLFYAWQKKNMQKF